MGRHGGRGLRGVRQLHHGPDGEDIRIVQLGVGVDDPLQIVLRIGRKGGGQLPQRVARTHAVGKQGVTVVSVWRGLNLRCESIGRFLGRGFPGLRPGFLGASFGFLGASFGILRALASRVEFGSQVLLLLLGCNELLGGHIRGPIAVTDQPAADEASEQRPGSNEHERTPRRCSTRCRWVRRATRRCDRSVAWTRHRDPGPCSPGLDARSRQRRSVSAAFLSSGTLAVPMMKQRLLHGPSHSLRLARRRGPAKHDGLRMRSIEMARSVAAGTRRVAVLLLVAAFAISACIPGQASREDQADVESELRSAAVAMEMRFNDQMSYPSGTDVAIDGVLAEHVPGRGVQVSLLWSDESAFCLEAEKGGATSWYASADGGITRSSCR